MIDWSKLKPYHNDNRRSFEELCYQVAKALYGHLGRFTSVDDTGGGDGVEFYLSLPTGTEWGWQAKFYFPESRLSSAGRKRSIINSLTTSCRRHPNLTKWFLCTPTNFTVEEQAWFEHALNASVPDGRAVELTHWGDSEFNTWLSEPRFTGKRHYFFGELELSLDWFKEQSAKQLAFVGDKFNPILHAETLVDSEIHDCLGDSVFIDDIRKQLDELRGQLAHHYECLKRPILGAHASQSVQAAYTSFMDLAKLSHNVLGVIVDQLWQAQELVATGIFPAVPVLIRRLPIDEAQAYLTAYRDSEKRLGEAIRENAANSQSDEDIGHTNPHWDSYVALQGRSIFQDIHRVIEKFGRLEFAELHVLGDAGVGKTHLAAHICQERLDSAMPAIFVNGAQFSGDGPLTEQLRQILDIPPSYSWTDFLIALSSAAEAYHTRIPIIIDGLDAATNNGAFSRVWELGLSGLAAEIGARRNLLLITTSRTTYQNAIWPNVKPQHNLHMFGFDIENIREAMGKYFEWYKIRADLTGVPFEHFRNPLYLKIFCEITNSDRAEEVAVYVGEVSLFEIFDKYLQQRNAEVCRRLGLHEQARTVPHAMSSVANYFWQHRTRRILLDDFVTLVDGQPLDRLVWNESRTKAILDEGLLVCRDWGEDHEFVYFTYDLLGGYLIAKQILAQAGDDPRNSIQAELFNAAIFAPEIRDRHPLHSDIGRSVAALLLSKTGLLLHQLVESRAALAMSIRGVFEVAPQNVTPECIALIAHIFEKPQNRGKLLKLAWAAMGNPVHPLNIQFWSERLYPLSMAERDISWTEHTRQNRHYFEDIAKDVERICRIEPGESNIDNERLQCLAQILMWVLTSTVRSLRDRASRALYWYGRRFPGEFVQMLWDSQQINDPYVPERMLAAMYGVAIARQTDFADRSFVTEYLPAIAQRLFQSIFAQGAPHATTHVLARDYARRTVDIAVRHYPDLFSQEQLGYIQPPFRFSGIANWGEKSPTEDETPQPLVSPLQMDFHNYVLGRLVPDRSNYDDTHPEFQKVVANILWRIQDLGYSIELFGEIDRQISNLDWTEFKGTNQAEKTERYGKKYSWIAYHELTGHRQGQGLLSDEDGEPRLFDFDIDPSFPDECQKYQLLTNDLLGDRTLPVEQWLAIGSHPDLTDYLVVPELLGQQGPWILLDGFVRQKDPTATRRTFVFPRGLIAASSDAEALLDRLKVQDLGRRWLPEVPEDYSTYAGEIPWSDTYPPNGLTELSFITGTQIVTVDTEKDVIFQGDEPLDEDNERAFWDSISDQVIRLGDMTIVLGDGEADEVIGVALDKQGLEMRNRPVAVEREIHQYQELSVLLPVRETHWEQGYSVVNPARTVMIPTREVAEYLKLSSQPQTFDLFDEAGTRASISFEYGDPWHTFHRMVYIRQDLLDRYLRDTNSTFIWAIWGENEYHPADPDEIRRFAEKYPPRSPFQDVVEYIPGTVHVENP